jgi:REP element-mobilizing transposase RayT
MKKKFSERKIPVHMPLVGSSNRSVIIYITVCANKHKKIFDNRDAHQLIVNSWRKANNWLVGRYVLMPDHIHFFCAPSTQRGYMLNEWIKYWKTLVSRSWNSRSQQPIWQKSFWDRQLRNYESYAEKWDYVRSNPVRAELCTKVDDWPWQGEINVLGWHD